MITMFSQQLNLARNAGLVAAFALTATIAVAPSWRLLWIITWLSLGLVSLGLIRIGILLFKAPERQVTLASVFLLAGIALVFWAGSMLPRLTFIFTFVALAAVVVCGLRSRASVIAHWLLGTCVAIAPIGGWIAARGSMEIAVIAIAFAAFFWATGFDIMWSISQIETERKIGLRSLPARWGARISLLVAAAHHGVALWLLALFGQLANLNWLYYLGIILLAPGLFLLHQQVNPKNLSRVAQVATIGAGLLTFLLPLFTYLDVVIIGTRIPF